MNWTKRYLVLVSAEFLQMDLLVDFAARETSKFVSKIKLNVLSKSLLDTVANHLTAEMAEQIDEDSIRDDIYKRLAINLACSAKLFKCSVCQNILPWEKRSFLR